MEYLILDDSDKISLEIDGWGITFHTLHTEQCIATLLDRYNTLSVLIPDEKRAKVSVNPNALSHTPFTRSSPHPDPRSNNSVYCDALRTMYHYLRNQMKVSCDVQQTRNTTTLWCRGRFSGSLREWMQRSATPTITPNNRNSAVCSNRGAIAMG